MKVTKDGIKDRQPHIEDYLQMVSAEQKEYAEVFAHQRIAENNDIITVYITFSDTPCNQLVVLTAKVNNDYHFSAHGISSCIL